MSEGFAKKALICGITGQDGSYLTELLIRKGYQVHGIIRRTSTFNTERLDHMYMDPHEGRVPLHLHFGDLANAARLRHLIQQIQPDEIYNLGAQSHVRVSFDIPEYTADITGVVNYGRPQAAVPVTLAAIPPSTCRWSSWTPLYRTPA